MSQFEQINERLERIENLLDGLAVPKKEKFFARQRKSPKGLTCRTGMFGGFVRRVK